MFWHKWAQWPFFICFSTTHCAMLLNVVVSPSHDDFLSIFRNFANYYQTLWLRAFHAAAALSFSHSYNDFEHFSSCYAKNSHPCTTFTILSICLSCKFIYQFSKKCCQQNGIRVKFNEKQSAHMPTTNQPTNNAM